MASARRAGELDDAARRRVLRAQAHDPEAFAELVRRHERPIYTFILGIVRNREDASDVAQEVWIKVAKHIGRLRDAEEFRPWLYRIARNSCLDFLRARKSRFEHFGPETSGEESDAPELPDLQSAGPEQQALALDGRHRVWETLGRLSKEDRAVLFLREYLEIPYADVAHRLGISTNAAEVRVSRARARFRRQYAKVDVAKRECNVSSLELSVLIDLDGRDTRKREVMALREHVEACQHCTARLAAMYKGRTLYRDLGMFSAPVTLLTSIAERLHLLLTGPAAPAALSASETAADSRSAGPIGMLAGGAAAKAAALVLAVAAGTGIAGHEHASNLPVATEATAIPAAAAQTPVARTPAVEVTDTGTGATQDGPVELNIGRAESSGVAAADASGELVATSTPSAGRTTSARGRGARSVIPLSDDLGQWALDGVPAAVSTSVPGGGIGATAVASPTGTPHGGAERNESSGRGDTAASGRSAGPDRDPGALLIGPGPIAGEGDFESASQHSAAAGDAGNGPGRGAAQGNGQGNGQAGGQAGGEPSDDANEHAAPSGAGYEHAAPAGANGQANGQGGAGAHGTNGQGQRAAQGKGKQ